MMWAALIKMVYEVDPLVCPKCGGKMKIISFIEQEEVIRRILTHCGLWRDPPERPPPRPAPAIPPPDPVADTDVMPDYLIFDDTGYEE